MAKQIALSAEAREHLIKGMRVVAEAVRTTLGPKGRNVALSKRYGKPTVTHDGVTVAKEIELSDPFENMGAQLIKEAASKTKEEIGQIAAISAAEQEIGDLIGEVMDKVGKDGAITVEESKGLEFEVEYVEGMEFDRGFISPYFVTDEKRMEAEIDEPYILLSDKKLSAVSDILPTLEKVAGAGKKELLVIAEDIDGEALATLVVNKLRGVMNCLAVKAPGYGDRRKAMLQDIAILTGGTVISEDMGRRLDGMIVEDLGRARRVISDKDNTTVVEGQGTEAAVQGRIHQLKSQLEEATSDYDREKLQERLAKL